MNQESGDQDARVINREDVPLLPHRAIHRLKKYKLAAILTLTLSVSVVIFILLTAYLVYDSIN